MAVPAKVIAEKRYRKHHLLSEATANVFRKIVKEALGGIITLSYIARLAVREVGRLSAVAKSSLA